MTHLFSARSRAALAHQSGKRAEALRVVEASRRRLPRRRHGVLRGRGSASARRTERRRRVDRGRGCGVRGEDRAQSGGLDAALWRRGFSVASRSGDSGYRRPCTMRKSTSSARASPARGVPPSRTAAGRTAAAPRRWRSTRRECLREPSETTRSSRAQARRRRGSARTEEGSRRARVR